MPADNSFAKRLNAAFVARGVGKMYSLAVELDVNESAICRWRQGRPISMGNLIKLCRRLDVSIDWLLTGRGEMTPADPQAPDWTRGFQVAVEKAAPSGAAGLSAVFLSLARACEPHDAE